MICPVVASIADPDAPGMPASEAADIALSVILADLAVWEVALNTSDDSARRLHAACGDVWRIPAPDTATYAAAVRRARRAGDLVARLQGMRAMADRLRADLEDMECEFARPPFSRRLHAMLAMQEAAP